MPCAAPATVDGKPYTWEQVHEEVERNHCIGVHGACNSAFHGLAEVRANEDLNKYHKKRSPDEYINEDLIELTNNARVRENWNRIVTLDPLGLFATHPTMAACTAIMDIPEIRDLEADQYGVVNADSTFNIVKLAIDYVWNLPGLAARLGMDEDRMREALRKYTQNENLLDKSRNAYLPPVGGATVYFMGDIKKLADPKTEVAVRVHDSCAGSDVFGTDICTCRPYLVYAIKQAAICAQRGGVGLIIYFQKEGRSLGEVTKFRVYNARKRQEGGDCAEKYFQQTESIAGIRDARFQDMMPDVLVWLGVQRIDWLLSMSSEKYDAIVGAGIKVMQRVELPEEFVPKGATVEIMAKISAGYHSERVLDPAGEGLHARLRELETVRQKCGEVFALAKEGKTRHLNVDLSKLPETCKVVTAEIRRNYPDLAIPYHSRWRHLTPPEVTKMYNDWKCDKVEKARRMVDLALVSVLVDAGAGTAWKYTSPDGTTTGRSEGLAVASLAMFKEGTFSSDVCVPHRVNSQGIRNMTLSDFNRGFQITNANPMVGGKNRYQLLQRLADVLESHPEFWGEEICRPGNVVDYVQKHVVDGKVSVRVLWRAIAEGLEKIWPETMSGLRRGDVWAYSPLKRVGEPFTDLVPFHKLSQWLCLSLIEPIAQLGIWFTDTHLFTALAEYRNGGLFVDTGVIVPKEEEAFHLAYDAGSELIIEWRALTVALMDELAPLVRAELGMSAEQLPIPRLLQGGSWSAGRRIAREKRPASGGSPFEVRSDGCVF